MLWALQEFLPVKNHLVWYALMVNGQMVALLFHKAVTWDVTVACTVADSYIQDSSRTPGAVAELAATSGIPSLQARRLDLSKSFFSEKFVNPLVVCTISSHPPPRDPAVTSRLWKPTLYPTSSLRTKRYCSTVMYGLLNFQLLCISCVWFCISIFVLSAAILFVFCIVFYCWSVYCRCLGLTAIKLF